MNNAEDTKRKWSMSYTLKSWGFGIEITFPARSERFFMGTKLQVHFGITIYFGPFTFEWTKPNRVIERAPNISLAEYLRLSHEELDYEQTVNFRMLDSEAEAQLQRDIDADLEALRSRGIK